MMRLTKRERFLAVGLTIFVGICSIYGFVVAPALERTETLGRLIPQKEDELRKIRDKSAEYVLLRDGFDRLRAKIASQDKGFELLPFLESLIAQHKLTDRVVTMKQSVRPAGQPEPDYSETIVEMKMENLSLSQLIDLLCEVQSSQAVARIRTLHIKRNTTDPSLLDCEVEIRNPKLIQIAIACN